MDGSCKGSAADKPDVDADRNPGPVPLPPPPAPEGRRPFTSLTQEEADLALARVLQEQERAYVMLTCHGGGEYDDMLDGDDGYDYYDEDEDEEEEEVDLDLDPARYDDDEAYARALQDAEERQVAGRLTALAGIGPTTRATTTEQDDDGEDEEEGSDEGDGDPQDAWEDVDPDEYSYEELVALGEAVGTESKGLSADTIASLPSVTYQVPQDKQDDGNMEQCVICRVELEEGESLVALPSCKHSYHPECINHWLQLNKVCPMCGAEVSSSTTSANKQQA